MKTLIIDWGRNDTYFYVKDSSERTIRKSRKFEDDMINIPEKVISIIKSYPDIKIIEIDGYNFGKLIIAGIKFELEELNLSDIEIHEYKFKAL